MTTTPDAPTLELPSLSDLSLIQTEVVTVIYKDLMRKYHATGAEVFRSINDAVKRHQGIMDDCLTKYQTDRIGEEIFLASINNQFAVLSGVRRFILAIAETLPLVTSTEPLMSQGRWILEEAERELESMMTGVMERVKESVRHEPHPLFWDDEKGFYLHKVNIAPQGFGIW